MIKINNLHKSFGKNDVLKGITTEIKRGEVVAIIGPSGSGKSTFLRCINLLEIPTKGEIFIEGENLTDKKTNIDVNTIETKLVRKRRNAPHIMFHLKPTPIPNPVEQSGGIKATAIATPGIVFVAPLEGILATEKEAINPQIRATPRSRVFGLVLDKISGVSI